jgi:hypothetical protein
MVHRSKVGGRWDVAYHIFVQDIVARESQPLSVLIKLSKFGV